MEDRHSTQLHEDMGALKADVRTLMETIKTLNGKVDLLTTDMGMLKTRVAIIAGGIGSVISFAGTFVWDKLTGKNST
jgi:hypothetical protein